MATRLIGYPDGWLERTGANAVKFWNGSAVGTLTTNLVGTLTAGSSDTIGWSDIYRSRFAAGKEKVWNGTIGVVIDVSVANTWKLRTITDGGFAAMSVGVATFNATPVITGSAQPQITFTATSGSSVDGVLYQLGNSLFLGTAAFTPFTVDISAGVTTVKGSAADMATLRVFKHGSSTSIVQLYETGSGDGEIRLSTSAGTQKVSLHSNAVSSLTGGGLAVGDTTDPGAGGFRFTGSLTAGGTKVTTSGTINNQALASTTTVIQITGLSTLGGVVAGADGRVVIIQGTTAGLTINHEDASSTAANRIWTRTGAGISIQGCCILVYSAADSRWLACI